MFATPEFFFGVLMVVLPLTVVANYLGSLRHRARTLILLLLLIYASAWKTSWRAFRAALRLILLLAVGLVPLMA